MNPHLAAYLDAIDGVGEDESQSKAAPPCLQGPRKPQQPALTPVSRLDGWGSVLQLTLVRLWLVETAALLICTSPSQQIPKATPLKALFQAAAVKYGCLLLVLAVAGPPSLVTAVGTSTLLLLPLLTVLCAQVLIHRRTTTSIQRTCRLLRYLCHSMKKTQLSGLGRQLVHPLPPAASLHRALEMLKDEQHPMLLVTQPVRASLLALLTRMISFSQELEIATVDREGMLRLSTAHVTALEETFQLILNNFHEYVEDTYLSFVEDCVQEFFASSQSFPTPFTAITMLVRKHSSTNVELIRMLATKVWESEIELLAQSFGGCISQTIDIDPKLDNEADDGIRAYLRLRKEVMEYRLELESAAFGLWLAEKRLASIPTYAFNTMYDMDRKGQDQIAAAMVHLEDIPGGVTHREVVAKFMRKLSEICRLSSHLTSANELLPEQSLPRSRAAEGCEGIKTPFENSSARNLTHGLYGDEDNTELPEEHLKSQNNVVEVYAAIVNCEDCSAAETSDGHGAGSGNRLSLYLLQELRSEIAARREMFVEKQLTPDLPGIKNEEKTSSVFSSKTDTDLPPASVKNQVELAAVLKAGLLARLSDEMNSADQFILES